MHAVDGDSVVWLSPWIPFALVYEDLVLAAGFAAFSAVARGRAAWAVALVYGVACAWTAGNIPVARVMSTPMTFSFLHATGGALGDSIKRYVTPTNVALPLLAGILALFLPMRLARWSDRLPAKIGRRGRAAA